MVEASGPAVFAFGLIQSAFVFVNYKLVGPQACPQAPPPPLCEAASGSPSAAEEAGGFSALLVTVLCSVAVVAGALLSACALGVHEAVCGGFWPCISKIGAGAGLKITAQPSASFRDEIGDQSGISEGSEDLVPIRW